MYSLLVDFLKVFVFEAYINLSIQVYFFNSETFLNLISVRQNKSKAAVIIEGPEAELNFKDENNPINTDNKPSKYRQLNHLDWIVRNIPCHSSWHNKHSCN